MSSTTIQLEDLGCSRIFSSAPILQPAFTQSVTGRRVCLACQGLCHNGDTYILPKTQAATPPAAFTCQCRGPGDSGCLFEARFGERMPDAQRRDAVTAYAAPMRHAVVSWTDKARPVVTTLLGAVEYITRSMSSPDALRLAQQYSRLLQGMSGGPEADARMASRLLRTLREMRKTPDGAWFLPFATHAKPPPCQYCHQPMGPQPGTVVAFAQQSGSSFVYSDSYECGRCWTRRTLVIPVGVGELLQKAITWHEQREQGYTSANQIPSTVGSLSLAMCIASLFDVAEMDVRLVFPIRILDNQPVQHSLVEYWDDEQGTWRCMDPVNGVDEARASISSASPGRFDRVDFVVSLTLEGELNDVTADYLTQGGTCIDKEALARAVYAPSAASAAKRLRDEVSTMPTRRIEAAKRRAEQRTTEIITQEIQSMTSAYRDLDLCPYDDPSFVLASSEGAPPSEALRRFSNAFFVANQHLLDTTADNDSDVPLRPHPGEVSAVDLLLRGETSSRGVNLLGRCLNVWPEKSWPGLAAAVRIFVQHYDCDAVTVLRLSEWAGILRDRVFAMDMLADMDYPNTHNKTSKPQPRWNADNTMAVIALTQVAVELWRKAGTTPPESWNSLVTYTKVVLECGAAVVRPENANVVAFPPAIVSHAYCGIVEAAVESLLACASADALTAEIFNEISNTIQAVAVTMRGAWFVSLDSKLKGAFEFVAEFEHLLPATTLVYSRLATRLKDAPGQQLRQAILSRFNQEDGV